MPSFQRSRRIVALYVALGMWACSDSLGPESPINGTWTGSPPGGTVTLTLTEATGGSVSGSGNVSGSSGAAAVTVTGTHTGASVSLTLSAQGFQPTNFTGTVQSDGLSMIGTLNGSGFQNAGLTLTRPKPS